MSHFEKVSFERWKADCGIKGLPVDELRKWYDEIKLPCQATAGSAGCDFFMPFNLNLAAGGTFRVATGIRWLTQDGGGGSKEAAPRGERDRVLLIFPRSGLGFKYGIRLSNTVAVIDADYCDSDNEGHIIISIENPSREDVQLEGKKPFVQGIVVKFEVPDGAASASSRNGGFGSTDGRR